VFNDLNRVLETGSSNILWAVRGKHTASVPRRLARMDCFPRRSFTLCSSRIFCLCSLGLV